jgi:transposase
MPRSYVHVKLIEKEIFEMKAAGKSNRKIREQYGLSEKQLKNLITRHNRAEERLQAGIQPRRRGRPPKGYQPTEQEKDNEIKRLKMENELLRDFLQIAGRK